MKFFDDSDPYVADFEEVLRVVELSSGFVLLPIGVSGPDLAEVLAQWLGRNAHPTVVSIPDGDAEWKNVGTWLLQAKPEKNGVVVVIGGSEIAPEFSLAMRLVNERRDVIAKHLDCPLLWCGPREFLLATAEHAPDFWSVRAVERYIKAAEPKPRKFETFKAAVEKKARKNELLHDAIRQGDRQSTEVIFLSQLRQAMAEESGSEFDSLLKSIPEGLEQTDTKYRFESGLMRAEMARRRGKIAEALEILDALGEPAKMSEDECRVELLRGRVWEKAGDISRAKSAYDEAKVAAHHAHAELLYLLGCIYSDALDPKSKGYGIHLRDHCQSARKANDRPLEAFTLALLVIAATRKHDRRHAQQLLRDAVVLHEASKGDDSILFPGEVEEALRRASSVAFLPANDDASLWINEKGVKHSTTTTSAPPEPKMAKRVEHGITKTSAPPEPITAARVEQPPKGLSNRFLVLLILVLIVFVILFINYMSTPIPADTHCFHSTNNQIVCAESLERCEKLRAAAGNAAAGPCQKPQFGKSD